METPGNPPAGPIGRRTFFANLVLGVAGALSLGALGQRMYAFLSPPAPPEKQIEVAATQLSAIPDGGGTVMHLPGGHVALERTGDTVKAFSAVCTHLGCIIQYQPASDHAWYCPCHGGQYDRAGRVVAGPPPRPLQPIPATVRDGLVYVTITLRAPQGVL